MLRGLPTWRGLFIFMAESAFVASFYYRLIIFGSDVNFPSGRRGDSAVGRRRENTGCQLNPCPSPDANSIPARRRMRTGSFGFHKGPWRYIESSSFHMHSRMRIGSFGFYMYVAGCILDLSIIPYIPGCNSSFCLHFFTIQPLL